jgi:PadR family transcriptional regulator PadR
VRYTLDADQTNLVKEPAPNEWTSQLRRGVLELCILKLLRDEPSYGYEIVTTLETLGPLAAGENTVYPLLRRLKADRHLETFAVESPAGPARQYYRLTAQGRQRLAALEREWGDLVRAVDRCLKKGVTA